MAKWMVAAKKADFDKIAEKYHITPVMARIMRNRDLVEDADIEKYLHGNLEDLYDPLLMKGMKKAAEIIAEKIAEGARIRVIGDYDVDGICASYILITGLCMLGGECRHGNSPQDKGRLRFKRGAGAGRSGGGS